jgi:hypothetical protein
MKKKILIVLGLLLISGTTLVASEITDLYVSGKWNYKITVNVQTPDGVTSGSTIRQLSHSSSPLYINLPDAGRAPKGKGEAITVDLGEKGKLFGLVSTRMYRELYETFPFRGAKKIGDGIRYYNGLPIGKNGVLPRREYPRFVMFEDINDPMTVKVLDPDNFEKVLGRGYSLEGINIEITDKPLVWKMAQTLPWLNRLNGGYLHGGSTSRSAPLGLHAGNFREGNEFKQWRKSLKYSDPRKISPNDFKQGEE